MGRVRKPPRYMTRRLRLALNVVRREGPITSRLLGQVLGVSYGSARMSMLDLQRMGQVVPDGTLPGKCPRAAPATMWALDTRGACVGDPRRCKPIPIPPEPCEGLDGWCAT